MRTGGVQPAGREPRSRACSQGSGAIVPTMSRTLLLTLVLATAAAAQTVDPPPPQAFTFRREGVLGTSFRLTVLCGSEADAAACEAKALETIAAHEALLSTWSPESELAKLNARPWAERKEVPLSPALGTVLRQALRWRTATKGAFDAYLGGVRALWREAERTGVEPPAELLAAAAEAARSGPGFSIVRRLVGTTSTDLLTCDRDGQFDVDGIAKGMVIDQALQAAVRAAPGVSGALLTIGGDLRAWGNGSVELRAPWAVEVVDPRDPADNSEPLCTISVRDKAVASSGGYARPIVVAGQRHMHIFDPRTARPTEQVHGVTVVADDAMTADALTKAMCVLSPVEALAVAKAAKAECLIVSRDGAQHASPGWAALVSAGPPQPWPAGFRVEVGLTLRDSQGITQGGFKRHFLAAWVEDAAGRRLKVLALWANGRELKYLRELPTFWKGAWLGAGGADDPNALSGQTRATRKTGAYTLAWDGTDDAGRPVARGHYRLRLEVNREHGPDDETPTLATLELPCAAEPARVAAADQPELAGVSATYGPKAP